MSIDSLNLHGQIRLTLKDASPADVRAMTSAIGATEDSAHGSPDVEVRFTRQTTDLTGWRNLGEHDAYCSDGRLAICTSGNKSPIEVELPLVDGESVPFRLTYPSGLRRLPLLRSMINAKCIDKQLLGIHGTAFTYANRGYLVCGWPRGGKTGTLLAYLLQGAQYLAAEWVYVSHGGQMMHGVPEAIRLRDWHVRHARGRLKHVGLGDHARLTSWRYAAIGLFGLSRLLGAVIPKGGKGLRQLAAGIDRRRYIDRPAADWLGITLRPRAAPLHTILLVGTHASPDIQTNLLSATEAKRRLMVLLDEDFVDLIQAYRRWTYAVSDPSDWLACFYAKRAALLDQLVDGKVVYAVDHPHDVSLKELFHELQSLEGELCSLSH